MPHLTILSGPSRGQAVPITNKPIRIGRDPSVEISITDTKASRVHVEISGKDGAYILRDLKSKNGTLVNGTSVTALTLKEGDQIQIGQTRLVFSFHDAPPEGSKGKRSLDSVVAPKVPVGVVPAMGSAGVSNREEPERFETLEMNATLSILSDEAPKVEARPSGVNRISSAPGAPKDTSKQALRALYTIAKSMAECRTRAALLKTMTDGLKSALEADRITPVEVLDKDHWEVSTLESGDDKAKESKDPFKKISLSRTIVEYAIRSRSAVATTPRTDARFGNVKSIGDQGITSALCVPVIYREDIIGLIYADRLGGMDFTRADLELVTATCMIAGPAMITLKRFETAIAKKDRLLSEIKSQHNLLGESPKMKEVAAFIQKAAPTSSVVLVLGESGTGKELVARAIHYGSRRFDGPLIVVNCAALSETLIESELFGHAKGAFTGAVADRPGRFELAHEGTIFLDEIGELSNACQTKLLRVLEHGDLSRVGESKVRKVDVRVIAATNRDLPQEVKSGRFREDLYYRLNVLSISLPALRIRGEDVRLLLNHYLKEAGTRIGRTKMSFSEDAIGVLMRYQWPGNVRELRNLAERMAVLCPNDEVGFNDLPAECRTTPVTETSSVVGKTGMSRLPGAMPPLSGSAAGQPDKLADIERNHILSVLQQCDNNKKLAAERLGIDRSTLYAKLRSYGILA